MKKITTCFVLLIAASTAAFSQLTPFVTWVGGDNFIPANYPSYGVKGVASPTNNPGERRGAVSWTDTKGNLWLMGGFRLFGDAGYCNDLWKYTPSADLWTWVNGDTTTNPPGYYGEKGIPCSTNRPWPRANAASWTDAEGNFWLMGGEGPGNSSLIDLNDLWKYNTKTNLWTWVSGDSTVNQAGYYGQKGIPGSANKPGARLVAASWTDLSGNFWLMGGYGFTNNGLGHLNDLWKYDPSAGKWMWVSGDSIPFLPGVYGTKGLAAAENKPGARRRGATWTDKKGDLWLLGGATNSPQVGSPLFTFNDLWKYTSSTNRWTWMGGDSISGQPGVYGQKGVASATNQPGARHDCQSWTDNTGNLWLMGGRSVSVSFSSGPYLNDLWKYSPCINLWTWVGGDSVVNQVGVYGVKKRADITNKPGSRAGGATWTDALGNLWLMGGRGYARANFPPFNNIEGRMSDLWRYESVPTAIGSLDTYVRVVVFDKGTINSLSDILNRAKAFATAGDNTKAVHQLELFIEKVSSKKGKSLTDITANDLIARAGVIINTINTETENCSAVANTVPASAVNKKVVETGLSVAVYPNPGTNNFTFKLKSSDSKAPIALKVFDQSGRLLESKTKLLPGQVVQLGSQYHPGVYYAELEQGKKKVGITLVKQGR